MEYNEFVNVNWLKDLISDVKILDVEFMGSRKEEEWLRFKSKLIDGDEVWYFKSDPESWLRLHGRAGYCILRNGEVISSIVTFLN